MQIALEAMGGDYAPRETVAGALLAAKEYRVKIVLVGNQKAIEKELQGNDVGGLISIKPAAEVIKMAEHPVAAVRRKRHSSIVLGNQLVKEGRADAVVSVGNTGAAMAASLFGLGRVKGIDRPAIGAIIPTAKGLMVLVDAGANVDCKPRQLQQFAMMGALYAQKVLNIANPRVGLINVGVEENKGNELTQATYSMLKNSKRINFIGNVESRTLPGGNVDVAVCDGFTGNVILKTAEGIAMSLFDLFKQQLASLEVEAGSQRINKLLAELKQRVDYAEYGGAPLLGVNGVSIIGHGSSKARAVKNAIRIAKESVQSGLITAIKEQGTRNEAKG
ncbi:MAG: phosphate acyltransferase PlsX [Desulfotomaculum sp.]|nr:phosphate acyltransferase PlsX [Desulfotomaculum sp.]